MKIHVSSALLLLASALVPAHVQAQALVSMEGIVEAGALDGVDLAGTAFRYEGLVVDRTDIDDLYPRVGTFVVENASIDFGVLGTFHFEADAGYFYWGIEDDRFYAYAGWTVDVPSEIYGDGFGYAQDNSSGVNLDESQLESFGPFTEFDRSWTFNEFVGPFVATNGSGRELVFSRLAPQGVLTVRVVPEPTAAGLMLAALGSVSFGRSRRA